MKLVFVSNYLTHHQKPLSDELYKHLGNEFAFIETEKMTEERLAMGWKLESLTCPYVYVYDKDALLVQRLIDEADVVIIGGTSDKYIRSRLHCNKYIYRYEERPFKKGGLEYLTPRKIHMMLKCHTTYRQQNVFLLCAGAYVANDMNLFDAYPNKKYAWGYFPEFVDYGDSLPSKSFECSLKILWSGRMIDWKHPELAVSVAEFLKNNHVNFKMRMIGNGPMSAKISHMVSEKKLTEYITLVPSIPYTQMATEMQDAHIFLMTSDRQEGWGAVANEAMNNGAILVANKKAGSIPFLIQHGITGFSYSSIDELYSIMLKIATDSSTLSIIRENAYKLISLHWNPSIAAQNLLELIDGKDPSLFPSNEPCRLL